MRRPLHTWLFRVCAMGFPLFLLLGLESLLRIFGGGAPTTFFLPWKTGSGDLWVNNPVYGKRFFPPGLEPQPRTFAFPERKDANTVRIFVLGESAALGDPDPKFGFAAMLQSLLRSRFPERRFEVINASMVAINSHVIRSIARDCAPRQGDIWVVYMGNNEVIGPFGAATVFGSQTAPLAVVRANLALKETRIGQLLQAGVRWAAGGNKPRGEWRAMEMFSEQKIRFDDPLTLRVQEHFRSNLEDILRLGVGAGARILLCTVGTNVRDCGPFASLHRAGLTEKETTEWEAAFNQGMVAEREQRHQAALVAYEAAAGIDGQYAELQYRMGKCHLTLGDMESARKCFVRARDYDALQFRADSRVNETIRASARTFSGVRLVDVEGAMARRSTNGGPGLEFFYEHVHLTPRGNYLIACSLAEEVGAMLAREASRASQPTTAAELEPAVVKAGEPGWLSEEDCLRHLGYTDQNRQDGLSSVLRLVQRPPFTPENHGPLIRSAEAEFERLRAAVKPSRLRAAVPMLQQVAARHPDNPELRVNLAGLLEAISDFAGAEQEWRKITELWPHSAPAFYKLGAMLELQNHLEPAIESYAECLKREPDSVPVRIALGRALIEKGQYQEASKELEKALKLDPANEEAKRLILKFAP